MKEEIVENNIIITLKGTGTTTMTANYHTHTYRCRHASGVEREYVENAIKAGFQLLGFSDHTPYPFEGDYRSGFRMECSEIDGYFSTLLGLREEYKNDIDIKIGFETEYYPAYFESLMRLYDGYPLDYLILGQHFLESEITRKYSGDATADENRLAQYVDQTLAGLSTGVFTYFAHPDLLNFTGSPEIYEKHISRLCCGAKKLNVPLEINLLGIRDHRAYPRRDFFEIAAKSGCDVIIGSDAHSPDVVCDVPSIQTAEGLVKEFGLKLLDRAVLKTPKLR